MSNNPIKIKAVMENNVAHVKMMIKHGMETGLRKDKTTGETIAASFIKEVHCEHNGQLALVANWSSAISKDPYLSFKIQGAKSGDKIIISWIDNNGLSESSEATIN